MFVKARLLKDLRFDARYNFPPKKRGEELTYDPVTQVAQSEGRCFFLKPDEAIYIVPTPFRNAPAQVGLSAARTASLGGDA